MGQYLNLNGYFQSTELPELDEHQIVLDFRDEKAQASLESYAINCGDPELAEDIYTALSNVRQEGLTKPPD